MAPVNKYVSVESRSRPWPMFCVCENGCVYCSVPGVLSQRGGCQRCTSDRVTLTESCKVLEKERKGVKRECQLVHTRKERKGREKTGRGGEGRRQDQNV